MARSKHPRDEFDFELTAKPDPAFRRALFVLLVTIGVMVAGAFLYTRDARNDADRANRQRDLIQTQVDQLLENQERILDQNAVTQRRAAATEKLLAAFLAGSSDPAIAEALRSMGFQPAPGFDRRHVEGHGPVAQRPNPRPRPRPTTTARPRPTPSPTPTSIVPTLPPLPVLTTLPTPSISLR